MRSYYKDCIFLNQREMNLVPFGTLTVMISMLLYDVHDACIDIRYVQYLVYSQQLIDKTQSIHSST
jgi:hypothetical protein